MQNEALARVLKTVSERTEKSIFQIVTDIVDNITNNPTAKKGEENIYRFYTSRQLIDIYSLNLADIWGDVKQAIADKLEMAGFKVISLWLGEELLHGTVAKVHSG